MDGDTKKQQSGNSNFQTFKDYLEWKRLGWITNDKFEEFIF